VGEEEPDGDEDGDEGDTCMEGDLEWEEVFASPLDIRFTQEKIHPFFYRRGPIVNVVPKIRPILHARGARDDVLELVPPFNPIHCLRKGDELWSLDNRRLYALQLSAMDQWPQRCRVRLLCRERLPRHKFKSQYRKFNTTTAGRAIDVCARYQQFDTWNWFNRAVEIEWYSLSLRLGALLSLFEVLPVVGALLFRTGLTGFASRAPLIMAFVLTFTVDFVRQKVPAFERKICELHVRAVLDGDARLFGPWAVRLQRALFSDGNGHLEESTMATSGPQLAAVMALVLVLLLPYVLGMAYDKLRSSLLSCWLGVTCVLTIQLGSFLYRCTGTADAERGDELLTPKHRCDAGGDKPDKD